MRCCDEAIDTTHIPLTVVVSLSILCLLLVIIICTPRYGNIGGGGVTAEATRRWNHRGWRPSCSDFRFVESVPTLLPIFRHSLSCWYSILFLVYYCWWPRGQRRYIQWISAMYVLPVSYPGMPPSRGTTTTTIFPCHCVVVVLLHAAAIIVHSRRTDGKCTEKATHEYMIFLFFVAVSPL